MDIRMTYANFRKIVGIIGPGKFLGRIFYDAHRDIISCKDLSQLAEFPGPGKMTVSEIAREDVPALALLRQEAGVGGSDPGYGLHQYLDHGCRGIKAELNGKPVGYIWFGDTKARYDFDPTGHKFYAEEIGLGPGDVYSFDFFIVPKHRGGGKALEIIHKFLRFVRDLGYERCYGFVDETNLAARWIYKVIGNRFTKHVVTRRLCLFFIFKNRRFYFHANGHKWLFDPREVFSNQ